jgi:hypothetical protein
MPPLLHFRRSLKKRVTGSSLLQWHLQVKDDAECDRFTVGIADRFYPCEKNLTLSALLLSTYLRRQFSADRLSLIIFEYSATNILVSLKLISLSLSTARYFVVGCVDFAALFAKPLVSE